ncbi:hypothetical protein LI328DRAFT_141877 [Trichoderma asperelloides]|nr:hypothetical protein LI328DRAFT_141877 [Trichoderma asperelloides]
MIESYFAWLLLFGTFIWLLLSFLVTAAPKSWKVVNSRLDHSFDPLDEALNDMHNFSVAARASTAGASSLRETFRLNNPFTNGSEDLRKAYRQALIKAVAKMNGDAWDAIARSVSASVQNLILSENAPNGSTILRANVMEISRSATLVAVLKALFDIDHIPKSTLAYISVPKSIGSPCLCGVFSEAKERNVLAQLLLCTVSGTPETFNPLNVVMPAFEVPWRAVFYTLLAVLQDRPSRVDELSSLRDCSARQRPSPQAKAVVFESLRLYPPVRRMRVSRKATAPANIQHRGNL